MTRQLSEEQLEKNRLRSNRWAEANREIARQRARDWYAVNKDRARATMRRNVDARKQKNPDYRREEYRANRDAILAARRALPYEHPAKAAARERTKAWAAANPDRKRIQDHVSVRKRQAAKINRTRRWLTDEDYAQIATFYAEAARLKAETGEAWHVDHIIPLRGIHVSGLHVPTNLQVIRGEENLRKSNRYEDDA